MELDEYLLTECVQVNFVPISVSLNPPGRYREEVALLYRVFLEQAQRSGSPRPYGGVREEGIITLSTGDKFEDLVFSIKIYAETNESKNDFVEQCRELRQRTGQKPWARISMEGLEGFDKEDIGLMSYLPDDLHPGFGECVVHVLVPKVTFDGLFTAARFGHLSGEISIFVECMQGGKWDNKTFAYLPVTSIAFGEIPLAAHTVKQRTRRSWLASRSWLMYPVITALSVGFLGLVRTLWDWDATTVKDLLIIIALLCFSLNGFIASVVYDIEILGDDLLAAIESGGDSGTSHEE